METRIASFDSILTELSQEDVEKIKKLMKKSPNGVLDEKTRASFTRTNPSILDLPGNLKNNQLILNPSFIYKIFLGFFFLIVILVFLLRIEAARH